MKVGGFWVALMGLALSGAAQAASDVPGTRYDIRLDALPQPFATPSVVNFPSKVDRPADALPQVPPGFRVTIFADGLDHPRWMAIAPNGDVFLAESNDGKISLLRDSNGDGRADEVSTFAKGFSRPHGLAVVEGALLVGDVSAIWRIPYTSGDLVARGRAPLTRAGALGRPGNHWTRNIAVSRDGQHIFVAVGSRGNVEEEPEPLATVQRFTIDGREQTSFAAGLRNAIGIAFYPGTDDLYVVVNERDGLGDGLVPDYLTRVQEGQFFGYPWAYLGPNPDPDLGAKRPDMVAKTVAPDLLFESHSAPVGLAFYDGGPFPADYAGDAFVALRGSWNSGQPTGYKVVRVPFEAGRPAGGYINFMTGFWASGTERAEVWGRPAGLAVTPDGSLLVADDTGGVVWRVTYEAPATPGATP